MKITVLGAGSWGTALSMTLWKNGHSVYLWTHDEKEAKYLEEKRKCMNLPDVVIPKEIAILTSGLRSAFHFYKIHGGKNASLRQEGANPRDGFQGNRREYALYHDGYFGRVLSGK